MSSNGFDLIDRKISCTVGTLDVSNLRVVFGVKRNLKAEPNTCELKIYNLSRASRELIEHGTGGKLTVRLEAGYEATGTSQLFLGETRNAWTTTEGNDTITVVQTGDSEKEMQEARINMSIGPTVPIDVALRAIVRTLGVGEGNVAQAATLLRAKGVATMFGVGTALAGNTRRVLTDFCRSAGLEWSVQDGRMQILDRGRPLSEKAVELGPKTGLVGSPSVDFNASSKTKRGGAVVKAKAFLIPELTPGMKVAFNARDLRGGYRIEEAEYKGDTHGQDWYADLTTRAY